MKILVVDVGGSHVKLLATGQPESRRFDSDPQLTPERLVKAVQESVADWEFNVISLGYPGEMGLFGPKGEPGNLGNGWVGFDFALAFAKPVRVTNDAAMQAIGAYIKGRMLFLGLGTGVGSALVADRVVIPLELGCLLAGTNESISDRIGKQGLERNGPRKWIKAVHDTVNILRSAFVVDSVVLGGGHADLIDPLPEGCRRGGNDDAFTGGFRLWDEMIEPFDQAPSGAWRVVG